MVSNNTQPTEVIPISGTFDIAKGRNAIRVQVASHRWPLGFNGRASTAMTALGELILLSNTSKVVDVVLTFIDDQPEKGVQLFCRLSDTVRDISNWQTKIDNIERICSKVEIVDNRDMVEIKMFIFLKEDS